MEAWNSRRSPQVFECYRMEERLLMLLLQWLLH
eukprot:gene28974-35938_t